MDKVKFFGNIKTIKNKEGFHVYVNKNSDKSSDLRDFNLRWNPLRGCMYVGIQKTLSIESAIDYLEQFNEDYQKEFKDKYIDESINGSFGNFNIFRPSKSHGYVIFLTSFVKTDLDIIKSIPMVKFEPISSTWHVPLTFHEEVKKLTLYTSTKGIDINNIDFNKLEGISETIFVVEDTKKDNIIVKKSSEQLIIYVKTEKFNEDLIILFKSLNEKYFIKENKFWAFPISEEENLLEKLKDYYKKTKGI